MIALVSWACADTREAPNRSGETRDQQEFEKLLEQIRGEYQVPAMAAAIVRNGEIVAAATGIRRIDELQTVELDDRFHIGSVSKPITATVIATLVEDRMLHWETTIGEALPELAGRIKEDYRDVTLEQLLSHRAGILPWEEDEEIAAAPPVTGSPTEQRASASLWLLSQPPVVAPGTEHVYSNAGYMIAAAMAEKATGMPWENLVEERLAKPLHLTTLGFGWPARGSAAQPWGHRSSEGGFEPHDPNDAYQLGPLLGPAGDLHMSISDLARFAQLHVDGLQGRAVLLEPATFQRLHKPIGDYALGWNVKETADHHLGGAGTFHAAIWVSVPRDVAIVVATNTDADAKIFSDVINRTLKLFKVPKP